MLINPDKELILALLIYKVTAQVVAGESTLSRPEKKILRVGKTLCTGQDCSGQLKLTTVL